MKCFKLKKVFLRTHLQDVNVCPSQTSGPSQSSPDGLCAEPLEVEEEQKAAEGRGREKHLQSSGVCRSYRVNAVVSQCLKLTAGHYGSFIHRFES